MHCVYFPPEVGGLESHVYHLCRALAARGHEVAVVTSRSRPESPAHQVMDRVQVWRTWFPGKHTVGWLAHAVGSVPRSLALARRADVLHAQAFQSVPPHQLARARTGAPLVTTFHTSHFLRLAERPLWRPLLGRLVTAGDHNLAASVQIARVAEGLAPGRHVEPLTNGVDTELFRPGEPTLPPPGGGRRRVIVPRRLFEKNGVADFVRALPVVAEQVDVEAVLVGDGPERGRLERLAREVGVADRIRFLGARAHAEMPGLLASAELAIFPSLLEATSVAALECMACGLPVAASNVGGLPEIVDDEVGALFRPADPHDQARVVVALLSRTDLPGLGERARRRVVERWSNARLADRHLEIYEEVARRRARPAAGGVHTSRRSHGEKR
jgi:glycosyltransferase involved in cell wall biosynthesis